MNYTALFLVALSWCKTHPAQLALALTAVASCFVTKLDKYPRMHALFSLLAHSGVNVPGVVSALVRLFTGRAVAAAAPALLVLTLVGCGASSTPAASAANAARANARGAVETATSAWVLAAQTCHDVAVATQDQALLDTCKATLVPAKDDLVSAAAAVDAWGPDAGTSPEQVACLVASAMSGVSKTSSALASASAQLAPVVADAVQLIALLPGAGSCAKDGE